MRDGVIGTVRVSLVVGCWQLQFDGHATQQTVSDECHAGSLRQHDIPINRNINHKRRIGGKIIMNSVDLPHFVSADIYGALLLKSVQVGETAMERVGRRKDIHSFEEIKSEEQKEQTERSECAYFDFSCVWNLYHCCIG